ncbi:hypothetical protein BpHYR1_043087 [Brachionus plicatilis]|uniref:Uncharacterized protein n=1 Tax=Brachionus plicatilis TaxID=10195 RepID=A0A3M7P437_BRAPC|nr:hypothetical protein BpHYR1_043087 [Brachionus plicatilis]
MIVLISKFNLKLQFALHLIDTVSCKNMLLDPLKKKSHNLAVVEKFLSILSINWLINIFITDRKC